jgi:D-alanyl-D-alanine carboxypeptidase/D-alanyl-D-alanine-endopeptidase (penicillin-binding protein 4)
VITLAFLLAARGVTVDGGIGTGAAPAEATVLAGVDSAPLAEIVGEMLTYSDNQTAELLIKELGVQAGGAGTTAAGARATSQVLADAGVEVTGATFVDGSGLSATNRVTCDLLEETLAGAGVASPVGEGLAVAGESGTLAGSFQGTPAEGRLRAKTGSLNDVRALAGFVTTEAADDLVFSLVLNRPPFIQTADAELRDRIALVLADYPQRPPLDQVEPLPVPR